MKLINNCIFIDDEGNKVKLTNRETALLKCLNKKDSVATYEIIFENVYKNDNNEDYKQYDIRFNKTIRTLVMRLRKKLEGKIKICTKNQRGYYLKYNYNIQIINE